MMAWVVTKYKLHIIMARFQISCSRKTVLIINRRSTHGILRWHQLSPRKSVKLDRPQTMHSTMQATTMAVGVECRLSTCQMDLKVRIASSVAKKTLWTALRTRQRQMMNSTRMNKTTTILMITKTRTQTKMAWMATACPYKTAWLILCPSSSQRRTSRK